MKYTKRDSVNIATIIIFFLAWPFVTTLVSIFNSVSVATKRFVTVAFSAIIGYNIYCFDVSGDSAHYVEHFIDYLNFGLNLKETFAAGRVDVFTSLSYWLVGLFTNNPHILFAFWGALYGLVMFESFRLISKRKNTLLLSFVFLSLLYFVNGHGNLGTIRFCLALWYFFYFFIRYLGDFELQWLFCMFLAPLIHTTFILPCVITLIYRYSFLHINMLICLMIISFVLGHVLPIGEYLGGLDYLADNENYSKYVSDNYINSWGDTESRMSFMHRFLMKLPEYSCLAILLIVQYNIKKCKDTNPNVFNLYKFVVIMYSFSSLFVGVPNMGRFQLLSYMVFLFLMYKLFTEKIIRYKKIYMVSLYVIFSSFIYMTFYNLNIRFEHNYLYPVVYLEISSK